MVGFNTIVTAILVSAVTGTTAFKTPCRYPYDNCGWVLANGDFGYTYEELQTVANTTDGSRIYDALYSCDSATGAISYSQWCGGAGKCQTGIVPNDNCVA
ncbi:hypothetical protein B0T25DRAFT_536125 [Lasiosphaeria hispida]|uniref:Uncharacterized protein n=1 Tax=Lasiosphaeria hispida TaxID=260671 RepID=A0AAJ0HSJ4_9PEZI|nr:hypothetical protein B0T25DRAFT_536125 [Lasiosphaeria hispida]